MRNWSTQNTRTTHTSEPRSRQHATAHGTGTHLCGVARRHGAQIAHSHALPHVTRRVTRKRRAIHIRRFTLRDSLVLQGLALLPRQFRERLRAVRGCATALLWLLPPARRGRPPRPCPGARSSQPSPLVVRQALRTTTPVPIPITVACVAPIPFPLPLSRGRRRWCR